MPNLSGSLLAEVDLREGDLLGVREGAASGEGALVDPYGGEADLEARTLRAVGPEVFADDPLRLLRAVRLGAGRSRG